MDKISDIFKNIKDRLSSPLFFSFIFSWIICNWKVTIALLWYDPKQIEKEEFKSIFDFIYLNTDPWNTFYLPLILAIAYTILSPIVSNAIRLFNSQIDKIGENKNLEITKGSNIPIEKFLSLKENYDARTEVLEKIIKDENKTKEDYEREHTERLKLEQQLLKVTDDFTRAEQKRSEVTNEYSVVNNEKMRLTKENSELEKTNSELYLFRKNVFNINILDGRWDFSINDTLGGIAEKHILQISNGSIQLVKGTSREQISEIRHFFYDASNKRVFFIKYAYPHAIASQAPRQDKGDGFTSFEFDSPNINLFINELTLRSEDLLDGAENQTSLVTYKKIIGY